MPQSRGLRLWPEADPGARLLFSSRPAQPASQSGTDRAHGGGHRHRYWRQRDHHDGHARAVRRPDAGEKRSIVLPACRSGRRDVLRAGGRAAASADLCRCHESATRRSWPASGSNEWGRIGGRAGGARSGTAAHRDPVHHRRLFRVVRRAFPPRSGLDGRAGRGPRPGGGAVAFAERARVWWGQQRRRVHPSGRSPFSRDRGDRPVATQPAFL